MAPSTISPPRSSNGTAMSIRPSERKDSLSGNYILREATIPERHACWEINSSEWRGPLTEQAYYLRESHLGTQSLTREGGIKYWVLVDPSSPSSSPTSGDNSRVRNILSACETIRKPSLVVRKDGTTEEVVAWGIGSVYTSEANRGNGYAKYMLNLLAERLKEEGFDGKRCGFSVLYSDIGKKFYARMGWNPHPSSHLAFPASKPTAIPTSTPAVKQLAKGDLPALCTIDCNHLLRDAVKVPFGSTTNARAVQLPTVDIMNWHHSREEFVGQYTRDRIPTVKGAYSLLAPTSSSNEQSQSQTQGEDAGENAVWAIWTHDLTDLKLLMLRLHIPTIAPSNRSLICAAVKRVLGAAAVEAGDWGFSEVQAWNPAEIVLETAAEELKSGKWEVVDREESSIASLMWYDKDGRRGEVEPEGIEWVGNEKFAWC